MLSYHYSRRPIPQLPDPSTLPFPANVIRLCSSCSLCQGCTAPVPGHGLVPTRVMLVGEAPGANEDESGIPFYGRAGQQLDALLAQSGLPREDTYITNVLKCRPPGNREPKPAEVRACSKWLNMELELVNPHIILAMGVHAARFFLGNDAGTMEHLHGRPVAKTIGSLVRIILPCYHPAAALYDSSLLRFVQDDFQVLRGLVAGRDLADYAVIDEYPDTDYKVADTPTRLAQLADDIRSSGQVAVDVETVERDTKLWSVQLSSQLGTAWFVPCKPELNACVDLTKRGALTIVHNYLHDVRFVSIPENNFLDTMTMAYLLGLPQGLKELSSRLCGVNMVTYREMVRPGQQKLSLDYLVNAGLREWSDPPEIVETKWDNKVGKIVSRIKKPWHISRKIARILSDFADNSDVDVYQRWLDIPEQERACVEKVMGVMPESSLADIKFDDAVQYAARDADLTLRVKLKMEKLIQEANLDFVLHMDIALLPMVNEMMRNGMAVDLNHFLKLSEDYDIRMRAKSDELADVVGHSFNPNSRPQVAEVVYKELGFKPTAFTPTGEVSTDDQELKKTRHPVAKGIIEYRRLSKMKGTYADNLIQYADSESRVHTTIKTTRTETGRLSSADPLNFQNIPTRNKEGRVIKNGFVAPDGWLLGEGDLGQIEMVVQAHMANCKGLIDLFLRGDDPHTTTASKIFGVSYEDAKQNKYRYPAKCFHPDTEVLTPDGWKRIADLTYGVDKVAQAIPSRCGGVKLEWAVPTEVFTTKHSSKKLIHLKNYGIDLRVTPDHRMLAWQDGNYRVVLPKDLSKQRYWANAGVMGGTIEVNADLLRLAVATEADGSYTWRKISFGFYNRRKIRRLRELAGGEILESDTCNGKLKSVHCIRLSRELSAKIKRLLDPNKSFPWWWLGLTPDLRAVALDELKYWDGGKYKRWTQSVYTSGNRQSQDVVQALAAITGRKTQQRSKMSVSRGRVYSVSSVYIKNHSLTRGDNLAIDEEDYTGDVACLSVPSSFVLVRDGGIPVITGQTMNFGTIYLISGQGLSEQIGEYISDLEMEGTKVDIEHWDAVTCDKYIADWYKLYPEVKDYQFEQVAMARRYGYVRDMFGRIRYIPEVSCPIRSVQESGRRMACNMPIQAGAQGIIKLAMGRLWRELPQTPWRDRVRWLMQIHDSLIVEIPDDDEFARGCLGWMRSVMCGTVKLIVPVKADFKIGKKWGELVKLEL